MAFAFFITATLADELPKTTRLLSEQYIANILAKIRTDRAENPVTLLCALSTAGPCHVFALPAKTNPLPTLTAPKPYLIPGLTPLAPAVTKPAALSIACPQQGQTGICHLVDSMANVSAGDAGLTLYLTGSHSAYLSKRAATGLLTSDEVRGLISEKTIGILPKAVEASAVSVLARSAIAKTGRGAAVAGMVLMTYAAFQYFYPPKDKPTESSSTKK